ncbi:nuclear receptor-interacting protein 2 [Rhincodon typus]|uniref:nuclear receptor-interacting protein 2 n=1 Tax=Rhincodon typus TaxID=259920 RepID=UPI0009A43BFD|nr:nuclear receptor-interacting protein 2 [Rhincodon typus]
MSDLKKNEMEIRHKAILHQQRRLKQATQFIHKDSADLLPLDGLKRLGTSKDLCCDQEIKVTINTGCQQNTISASCLSRIGLKKMPAAEREDCGDNRFKHSSKTMEQVETLEIMLGKEKVECSALVVENDACELSLGLQTLLSLKCVIDLDRGTLLLGKAETQLPFLNESEEEENDEEVEKE